MKIKYTYKLKYKNYTQNLLDFLNLLNKNGRPLNSLLNDNNLNLLTEKYYHLATNNPIRKLYPNDARYLKNDLENLFNLKIKFCQHFISDINNPELILFDFIFNSINFNNHLDKNVENFNIIENNEINNNNKYILILSNNIKHIGIYYGKIKDKYYTNLIISE